MAGFHLGGGGVLPRGRGGARAHYDAGVNHSGSGYGAIFEQRQHHVHAAASELFEILADSGEGRHEIAGLRLVVEAHHRDVLRHPHARFAEGPQDAQGHLVVAYEHGRGSAFDGKLLADPVLADIAAAHGATPAQVALAWAMAMGYAVIPSSTQRAHLLANLDSCQLVLGAEDMQRIAALERGDRQVSPDGLAPAWD